MPELINGAPFVNSYSLERRTFDSN